MIVTLARHFERLWLRTLQPGAARLIAHPLALAAFPLFHVPRFSKHLAYRCGLLRRTRLSCKTISVGNLLMGGTGKTPLTRALAAFATRELLMTTAILCRGYGGSFRGTVLEVSRNGELLTRPEVCGEEAWLLARDIPEARVLAGKHRAVTGQRAVDGGAELVLLDDGYQYWRLERDLDVVTFDTSVPKEHYRRFPLGRLREPLSRLIDADWIVMTGHETALPSMLKSLLHLLRRHARGEARFFGMSLVPHALGWPGDPSRHDPVDRLQGQHVLAVSNTASPERFHGTLRGAGAHVTPLAYPDHHSHSQDDREEILRRAEDAAVDSIVFTEKDEPTVALIGPLPIPTWILRVEASLSPLDDGGSAWDDLRQRFSPPSGSTAVS